jgi:tetratricopeptide (TPR) repeat protein
MKFVGAVLILVSNLAFAQENTRSTITPRSATAIETNGTTYAVIVAVDKYDTLPHLRFAVRDAELFRNFLLSPAGGSVTPANIRCYFDTAANTGSLSAGCLEWLNSRKIKKGDRIFFYLAGHGDEYKNEYFYFTYDAKIVTGRRNYKIQGNINITELKKYLLPYVTEDQAEVVFIIDACRVTATDTTGNAMAKRLARLAENDIAFANGFYSLYSTSGGALAYESPVIGGGHGYFTYYLVQGGLGDADTEAMGNNDGKITLNEFASYPKKMVPYATETQLNLKPGEGQVPEFSGQAAERKILFTIDQSYRQTIKKDDLYNALNKPGTIDQSAPIAAVTRSGAAITDPSLVKAYNNFLIALSKKELINERKPALYYFRELEKNWPGSVFTAEARLMLITELVNFSKTVIDLYLLGADTKLIESKARSNELTAGFYSQLVRASVADFTTAASHLEVAISLLGVDNAISVALMPRLWFLQARSHLDGNKNISLEQAIGLAEKALASDTSAVHIYHLLAMLESKRKNLPAAEKYFIKAMEGETIYNRSALELGFAFFKLKQLDEASVYYRMRQVDNEQYAAAYNSLALKSLEIGNDKQAERFFKKGLGIYPGAKFIKQNLTIFYQRKADAALQAGKLLEAEYYHDQAFHTMPGSAEVLINQANFYNDNRVKQYAKARDCYRACLDLEPRNILALHNFAILYYNNGLINKNKRFLDSAISLSRQVITLDNSGTFAGPAATRIMNAERASAKFQYSEAPLKNGINPALQIDTLGAPIAVAKKWLEVKQFPEAEKLLRSILRKDQNNINAMLLLSELYRETEKADSAIIYLEKAYNLNKNNIPFAIDLADAYLQNDDTKKARRLLASLVQADPYNATLVLWLGYTFEQEGSLTSAEAVYSSFYYKYPKNPEILERLYQLSLHLGNSGNAERYRRELLQVRR